MNSPQYFRLIQPYAPHQHIPGTFEYYAPLILDNPEPSGSINLSQVCDCFRKQKWNLMLHHLRQRQTTVCGHGFSIYRALESISYAQKVQEHGFPLSPYLTRSQEQSFLQWLLVQPGVDCNVAFEWGKSSQNLNGTLTLLEFGANPALLLNSRADFSLIRPYLAWHCLAKPYLTPYLLPDLADIILALAGSTCHCAEVQGYPVLRADVARTPCGITTAAATATATASASVAEDQNLTQVLRSTQQALPA